MRVVLSRLSRAGSKAADEYGAYQLSEGLKRERVAILRASRADRKALCSVSVQGTRQSVAVQAIFLFIANRDAINRRIEGSPRNVVVSSERES